MLGLVLGLGCFHTKPCIATRTYCHKNINATVKKRPVWPIRINIVPLFSTSFVPVCGCSVATEGHTTTQRPVWDRIIT